MSTDRDGKPCGPTLLHCSCCGAGKGEEHGPKCYVWYRRLGVRAWTVLHVERAQAPIETNLMAPWVRSTPEDPPG